MSNKELLLDAYRIQQTTDGKLSILRHEEPWLGEKLAEVEALRADLN